MQPIKVHSLGPEQTSIVGFALVAHESIIGASPAAITDGNEKLEIPLRFHQGDLGAIRAELHHMVDEFMSALQDS